MDRIQLSFFKLCHALQFNSNDLSQILQNIPNEIDLETGNSILHLIAQKGYTYLIPIIFSIEKNKMMIKWKNKKQQTPLHIAASSNHAKTVEALLEISFEEIFERDENGLLPIHAAACKGCTESIMKIYDKYPNIISYRTKNGMTLLHCAVLSNSVECINFICTIKGIEVNALDSNGCTPLQFASKLGYADLIYALFSNGGDLSACDNLGQNALHLAVLKNHLHVVELLVNLGIDITLKTKYGKTALDISKEKNFEEITKFLSHCYETLEIERALKKSKKVYQIKNLVFQGGGVRGIAYIGCLESLIELEKKNIINLDLQRIGGTSAGAVFALLISLGFDFQTLKTLALQFDFTELLEGPFKETIFQMKKSGVTITKIIKSFVDGSVSKLSNQMKDEYGIFRGDKVLEWAEKLIFEKTGIKHATFKELHNLKKQGKPIKDVYFIGTNLSTSQPEIFSYEHTPDYIVSDALRISISIPFIFTPHHNYIKLENGERIPVGSYYIDGGVTENYPIWLFDQSKYMNIPKKENVICYNNETLGFRFKNSKEGNLKETEINNFSNFLFGVIKCLYSKSEEQHRKSKDVNRTVYIYDEGVATIDFDLNEEKKIKLMKSGSQAVLDYFNE